MDVKTKTGGVDAASGDNGRGKLVKSDFAINTAEGCARKPDIIIGQ